MTGMNAERARLLGIRTQWPEKDGCRSILKGNQVLVRGRLNVENLEATVQVNSEQLEQSSGFHPESMPM